MPFIFSAEIESIQKYVVTSNKMWTIRAGSYILDEFNKNIRDRFNKTCGKLIYSSGGSVKAIFNDDAVAKDYGRDIAKKLKDATEIASLTWAVEGINGDISSALENVEKKIQEKRSKKETPISIVNHPLFIDCEVCKSYSATSKIERKEGDENKEYLVCHSCKLKFDKRKEKLDIYNKIDPNRQLFEDFEHLIGDDYLALICSDGNRLGEHLIKLSTEQNAEQLLGEFSKKLDEATTGAFIKTANEIFEDYFAKNSKYFPFMIVVLGGDDMSVVMPARYAFEFTKAFTENFVQETKNFGNNLPEVAISTGIAIAKRTFPFSNLFEVAEGLQSNAKNLSRWLKKNNGNGSREYSTVDFEVITESLAEEVSERRRHLNFGNYFATGRPYLIGDGEYPFKFKELLDIAKELKKEKVSNSFIHSLYDIVEKPSTMKIELDIKLRRLFKKHEAISDISGYEKLENNFEGKECLPILDIAEIYSLIGG